MKYIEVKEVISHYSMQHKLMLFQKLVNELESRDKFKYYTYNPVRTNTDKYLQFHKSDKKIKICKGSPRSGKTWCVIQDILMLILDEHPYNKLNKPPYTVWVIATSFKKIRETLFPMFKNIMPMNRIERVVERDKTNEYYIYFDNGARVIFKSQEEQIKEFTSAEVHIIMCDERIDNTEKRLQLRYRIIGTDGKMYFTMDTTQADDWIDEISKENYAESWEFVITDNQDYLPKEEIERIRNSSDEVERERLFEGRYAERDVNYIFKDGIQWTIENYSPIEPERYNVVNGSLVQDDKGILRIYKQLEKDLKYVLGFDPARGTGNNSNAGQIIADTGEQYATILNNDIHYTELPPILIDILRYYNNALFVCENQQQGIYLAPTIANEYNNMYIDGFYKVNSQSSSINWGIRTDEKIKNDMVLKTISDLKDNKILLHDEKTWKQLMKFVEDVSERNSRKKQPKYYGTKVRDDEDLRYSDDDLVMALLFADRGLNNYNYFNNIRSRRRMQENKVMTIDDLMNVKIFRRQSSDNFYSL